MAELSRFSLSWPVRAGRRLIWWRLTLLAWFIVALGLSAAAAGGATVQAAPGAEAGALFTPRLLSPVPAGWQLERDPDGGLLLAADDGGAVIWLGGESVDRQTAPDEFAEGTYAGLCTAWRECREVGLSPAAVLGGRAGHLRQVSGVGPGGAPLTALVATYVADGKGFLALAAAPSERFAEREAQLRSLLSTLELGAE